MTVHDVLMIPYLSSMLWLGFASFYSFGEVLQALVRKHPDELTFRISVDQSLRHAVQRIGPAMLTAGLMTFLATLNAIASL